MAYEKPTVIGTKVYNVSMFKGEKGTFANCLIVDEMSDETGVPFRINGSAEVAIALSKKEIDDLTKIHNTAKKYNSYVRDKSGMSVLWLKDEEMLSDFSK